MYPVIGVFAQWDHGIKSFWVTIVYLQTMRGFHVEDLVTFVAAEMSASFSGTLKKQV